MQSWPTFAMGHGPQMHGPRMQGRGLGRCRTERLEPALGVQATQHPLGPQHHRKTYRRIADLTNVHSCS